MNVVEVTNKKLLNEFLDFPNQIYGKYPRYVTPLRFHTNMMIGKLGTPQKHLFLALENGKIVARCGFKTHKHGQKETLNFGFFECLEGKKEAANLIFKKAQEMYPEHKIMGPFHFRMEDPYIGVLVDGYDLDPYFLMSYNPPYYDEYLQGIGLKKTMDLYTYELNRLVGVNDLIKQNAERARSNGYTVRKLNPKNIKSEARVLARIFNDALSDNWGFEEFLDSQISEMVMMLKLFVDLRMIAVVQDKNKKDVGSLIMIPNFNHLIKGCDGKISLKLVWRFLNKLKYTQGEIRGYALGVLKEAHGQGIGSLLVDEMYKWGAYTGYDKSEVSWVLANNGPMNELSLAMNGKQNKTYRIYEKSP